MSLTRHRVSSKLGKRMSAIHSMIDNLKHRPDVGLLKQKESWLLSISKGSKYICEVTVPFEVLEWFASVKEKKEKKEVWSDWMDYHGYDDTQEKKLNESMAEDIFRFVDRLSKEPLILPLNIYEK